MAARETAIVTLNHLIMLVYALRSVLVSLELSNSTLQAMVSLLGTPLLFLHEIRPVVRVFLRLLNLLFLLPLGVFLLVLDASINVALSVNVCQNCELNHNDEKDGRIHILNKLILAVRQTSARDEIAEDSLAPVIVQKAEVALDALETELL